ncbi:MAG: NADH-quinone oxidoreductase subunit D-related protein [Ignavibacteriaceae bacterium]
MKRLFGILENNSVNSRLVPMGEEKFLLFDGKDFTIETNNKTDSYPNYDIIKSRNSVIGKSEFFGEGVFVFRYGPVTSWVIEPGVFHIYTYGERILGINIDVSYKARNIEQKLIGLNPLEAITLTESVCGNFSFSHSMAFTNSLEKILGIELNPIIKSYKIIALELERIYNHLFVFSQLANAASQKVLTSHVQFLFEESLRTNFIFSNPPTGQAGSRYLKGLNNIGRLNFYPDKETLYTVNNRINNLNAELKNLYARTLESKNFLDRLHDTSKITGEFAFNNSLSGPSLRACGIKEDLREHDKFYENINIPTISFGDSLARLEVRIEEIFESIKIVSDKIDFIDKVKNLIPFEEPAFSLENLNGNAIGAIESPSGIIAYYTELENGKIKYSYISTPSLFGLNAIMNSLPGMIFTDFPFSVDSFGSFFADAAR